MRTLFEHLGLANLPIYRRVLRPGGLFPNHGITHCTSNIQVGMEHTGFEIHAVE